MTTYRRFTTKATADAFVITELEPTESHPINWTDFSATRDGAWKEAQSQSLPLVFKGRDGATTNYGVVFSPAAWERSVYAGYVAYGYSMSDGYYAPIKFETFVSHIRRDAKASLNSNDCGQAVKAALPLYLAALQTI